MTAVLNEDCARRRYLASVLCLLMYRYVEPQAKACLNENNCHLSTSSYWYLNCYLHCALALRTRTASFALRTRTASFALRTRTASFALRTRTASFALRTRTASFALRTRTASFALRHSHCALVPRHSHCALVPRHSHCALGKPSVSLVHGLRPMEKVKHNFSYVQARRKFMFDFFRSAHCFRGHYII